MTPLAPDVVAQVKAAGFELRPVVQSLVLDRPKRQIRAGQPKAHVSNQEIIVLNEMQRAYGEPVSQSMLFAALYPNSSSMPPSADQLLRVTIHRLRTKLRKIDAPARIVTVYGQGYRLEAA